MQNLHWKLIIIVVTLAVASWSLAQYGLHFGKDLAGGISLVYEVQLEDDDNSDEVIAQLIEVIKDRLNPQGQLDISVVQQGRNRIEVIAPLPSKEAQQAQIKYEQLIEEVLRTARISPGELRSALANGTVVEQWGGEAEDAFTQRLQSLQEAYDRQLAAMTAYEGLRSQETPDPSALNAAEAELAEAQIRFDDLFREVIETSIQEDELRRMLELSTEKVREANEAGQPILDDTGNPVFGPSPRSVELDALKQRFPSIADTLDQLVASYDKYSELRKGFNDAEDLKRLMRGAGVLDYRIAVAPGTTGEGFSIDQMRLDLEERGPDIQTSSAVLWLPINDLQQWYSSPQELQALQANPIGYFAARGLVAAEYQGQYYLLLYDRPADKLTHESGTPDWSIRAAFPTQDSLGRPAVGFTLDPTGGRLMSRLTATHIDQPMAIVLDGEVYSAPNINSRIATDGIIQGNFSTQEVQYLIRVLASGSLGVRLSEDPISENKLGPSIGADNLRRGLEACLIAVILVALVMAAYYFFAGGVADFALLCNAIFIFGIMAMQQASFTLPGIAGIVLTIGMAVDANVLIYERIREELFGGEEDLKAAIRAGYSKALSTIIDGNVTNLIVCLVLYRTATAEIKGFALTFGIGILATLFTALFVTRVMFTIYTDVFKLKKLPMLPTVFPAVHRALEPNINWHGLRKVFIPVSLVAVTISLALVFTRGSDMYDTEFRGGVSAIMVTKDADSNSQTPGRVMLTRQDVEQRVRSIAAQAPEGDPLKAFEDAAVLTAGAGGTGGESDSFQIKVAIDTENPKIMQDAINAIVREFSDVLEEKVPVAFTGSDQSGTPTELTFPVNKRYLGEVIGRTGLPRNVQEFEGGVAIVLQDVVPAVTAEEVESRIARVRRQPDFSNTVDRRVEVVGLDQVEGTQQFSSLVILIDDPDISYSAQPDLWQRNLVDREWSLITQAMTEEATLEAVSTYSRSVADALAASAIVAVGLSLIGILIYIWVRFGSFYYSLAAILALVHDVSVALGLLALTHFIAGSPIALALGIDDFRIDLGVVAALLTIIGYSLNDTIVILDRIRENRGKLPYATPKLVTLSINQTVSRTVLTSGTTMLAVAVMFGFGGTGIRPFTFCLLTGLIVGTYSSMGIAAPLVASRRTESAASSGEEKPAGEEGLAPTSV